MMRLQSGQRSSQGRKQEIDPAGFTPASAQQGQMSMKKREDQFINRDVSWMEFNSRVLDEADDSANPLLERLNFISIVSSNLDEFCMVRLAGVAAKIPHVFHTIYKTYGYDPSILMSGLKSKIRMQVARQYRLLNNVILPEMRKNSIIIASWDELTPAQKKSAARIMRTEIFPVLTPIGVDQSHPFPLLPNLALELLIRLIPADAKTEKYALMEVPNVIPRFIQLKSSRKGLLCIPAEELIRNHLDMFFNGAVVRECSCFRITRDMDLSIDEGTAADLMTELQIALHKTTKRSVVRLEHASDMSDRACKWLLGKLNISHKNALIQPVHGLLNLKSMSELVSLQNFPALRNIPLPPLPSQFGTRDIFKVIREEGPLSIHHPYVSFDPVIRMLESAADDPNVLAIKQTLYRVSGDSPIVHALIRAARNGKQVSVLVELKARFDEENNINWARSLAKAGAHVVYGIAGLKVHCKVLMIIRREKNDIRRYIHLSSGNYNDKTARLYTDIGYFSDEPLLAKDVSALFNVITGFSAPPEWNRLIVAPFNMLERIIFMIDREAGYSTPRNPGHIRIKINSLLDYEVIEHLYRAAEKNVRIELIVRGICALTPCSLSRKAADNIRIVSILDRFLEHERIYYFANNGSPEYYSGSADLMPRNLRRRIEILYPVDDPEIREELDFILNTNLSDQRKGHIVCGLNKYKKTADSQKFEATRSQVVLYNYYKSHIPLSGKND